MHGGFSFFLSPNENFLYTPLFDSIVEWLDPRTKCMLFSTNPTKGFQIGKGQIKISYMHEVPSLSWLKGFDVCGIVLSSLYHWRANKSAPLIQHLKHNESFRLFVQTLTSSSADDWYGFVHRAQGGDDAADLRLLNAYNGIPLMIGSNALKCKINVMGAT